MRIQFSDQFGSDVWDGTCSQAVFDADTCNGPQLLAHLETALGLPQTSTGAAVRAASLLNSLLRDESAYYHASGVNDALGCARRLLRDYDALRLHGWEPRADDTPRLRALAALCEQAPPGMSERLARAAQAMPARRARVDAITVHQPMETLPHLWRRVLHLLGAAGTQVTVAPPPREHRSTTGGFVQLLTATGPLEAANHVAAWLRAQGTNDVVLITPDATVDHALQRHGLPTVGTAATAAAPAVQLVLLTVHMAFTPMHPRLAVEFLSISPNPVPWSLRRRLLDALGRWPAVGSTAWCSALAQHAQEQPAQAQHDERALAAYFQSPLLPLQNTYPVHTLQTRLALVRAFLAAQTPLPLDALNVCDSLRTAAHVSGQSALSEGQLQRLLAMILAEAPGAQGADAQAGLFAVRNAASIIAPAKHIVWWDFTAESVPAPRLPTLLRADRAHLEARHVRLPSLAQLAAATAVAWRRPLAHAQESVLLVAPRTSATGDSTHPHPLWDEITAAVRVQAREAAVASLRVRQPTCAGKPLTVIPRALRAIPKAMTAPIAVRQRALKRDGAESPHSLETLLGCSVKWALRYLGHVQPAQLPPVEVTPLQIGSFAHHLLEGLAMAPYTSSDDAAEQARRAFDAQGPTHLAPLYLPGNSPKQHELRVAFAEAVKKLAEIRTAHGWRIEASEVEVTKPFHTIMLHGILDARLDNPKGIMDFKWGGRTKYRKKLEDGTASQLAIYSYLCADDEAHLPPVAYYILDGPQLLTPEQGSIAGAPPLQKGSITAMWSACKTALVQALQLLEQGTLTAPGTVPEVDDRDTVQDGVLRVAPPCVYCDFGALCGKQWSGPS